MENNIFQLEFDKTISNLSGNPLGRKIYSEQVANKVDYSKKIVILFPETISKLGSSFIQGFFTEPMGQLGLQGIEDNMIIDSKSINNLKEKILNSLR